MTTNRIPLSVPNISGNELKYIEDALSESWVSTAGPTITFFENRISDYVGSAGAVAVQSGTAGLHLSLLVLGVEPDEIVLVPSLTFIASINPIRYVGAEPIFLDVDESLCISNQSLRRFIDYKCKWDGITLRLASTNQKISGLVYVHVFGNTGDLLETKSITDKYGLFLLEDATESLGSKFIRGEMAGKHLGTIGDMGVFSFNGNKIITTGGGGMVVSNNIEYINNIRYLSTQAKDDSILFQHDHIGYNYRMTNLQAAMGIAQLERLEEFIVIKKRNYEYYRSLLSNSKNLYLLAFNDDLRPNYWFYSLFTNRNSINELTIIIKVFENYGVSIRPIWQLNHTQKPYKNRFSMPMEYSIYLYNNILNLPCSSNLTTEQVDRVVGLLLEYLHE